MAHFAELDENNIVIRVVVVNDDYEADGENWCNDFFGGGQWKQTSYNQNIRTNFAGIGFTYDSANDVFIPPQTYSNWVLNTTDYNWQPPTPEPTTSDGVSGYTWDEDAADWVLNQDKFDEDKKLLLERSLEFILPDYSGADKDDWITFRVAVKATTIGNEFPTSPDTTKLFVRN
jgi:hypothetical protein